MPMYPYEATNIRYVINVKDSQTPYPIVTSLANAKNLGFSTYLNDVPQMFFTLDQEDPDAVTLRSWVGKKAIVEVLRFEEGYSPYGTTGKVWTGFLLEADANERDVIFYCYGEIAALYWMHTDWNVQYKNAQISTIVTDAWNVAKNTTDSMLYGKVAASIQNPYTDDTGTTTITLPQYSAFHKRLLFLMNEMAALGVGNTKNVISFYISPYNGQFYFLRNAGQDLNITYEFGGGKVAGFSDIYLPVYRRNDIIGVGSAPNNLLLRQQISDSSDAATWGFRQEVLYFPWVRDSTELTRVTGLRAALAKRSQHVLTLRFYPGAVRPTFVNDSSDTGGPWLGDRVYVRIDRGFTSVDATKHLLVGEKVLWVRGTEHVRYELQERPA